MKKQDTARSIKEDPQNRGCHVNSTFNFSVGFMAVAVAGIAIYIIYNALTK